jgi:hypothetical protein
MPYKTNLELFGPVALAYLMDGPKPQTVLNGHIPISVLEQLKTAGMIKRKMVRQGSMATAWWWFMADAEAPTVPSPSGSASLTCDDPRIFDGLPNLD